MLKKLLILFLSIFLLFSCSKRNKQENIASEPSDLEVAIGIYTEAMESLKEGDAFYAAKKFKEVESLMPQSKWASKSSLMASYADYSRSSYSTAIFNLDKHIQTYPADKNIP